MTLDQMKQGQTAQVLAVAGSGPLRRRMLEMGLVPHTKVTVTGAALFGDPIRIALRGYTVCIRKKDAALVRVAGGGYGDLGACR